ncbi:hypothetical protein FACS189427_10780 [Planctomycetales bacterium]|nr:hypothetical protein FACS189427_10780 [Planctomycetales bacterium]
MPAKSKYIASCYFLNVGQGTSQVILLGGQRAVIVDTGNKRNIRESPLIDLLTRLQIQTIEALVLSHNDNDHIGDAKNIFDTYRNNINEVYFLEDRASEQNSAYRLIMGVVEDRIITKNNVHRLETGKSRDILIDGDIKLSVLFPNFMSNIQNERNKTCAIIALSVGTQQIIFSGDASIEAWKLIVENNGRQSLQILTIPHHGGSFADRAEDKKWFFDNVRANYAVVSVGSNNRYEHPKSETIQSFVRNNIEVFCTQSTSQCGNTGQCCGTIIADVSPNQTVIKNLDNLRKRKQQVSLRLCQRIDSIK